MAVRTQRKQSASAPVAQPAAPVVGKPVQEGGRIYLNEPLAATHEGRLAQMRRCQALATQYKRLITIGLPPSVVKAQRAARPAAAPVAHTAVAPAYELPPIEAYSDDDAPLPPPPPWEA